MQMNISLTGPCAGHNLVRILITLETGGS